MPAMTPADYVKRQDRQMQEVLDLWDSILMLDLSEPHESDGLLGEFDDLVTILKEQLQADVRGIDNQSVLYDELSPFVDDYFDFAVIDFTNWYGDFVVGDMGDKQFAQMVSRELEEFSQKWDKIYDKFVDVRQLELL